MKILTGDKVKILLGKDKNRTGQVVRTYPKLNTVLVKDINIFKRHLKAQKGQKGGIIEKERPLAASKLMLICPNCQKPVRVHYRLNPSSGKTRYCSKCQSEIISSTKQK
ncbi:MAG: 50S ribosomal protein L24 [Candidatus Shapirobacteria bacterium]|jgi:large subunit ribosomal protein L24